MGRGRRIFAIAVAVVGVAAWGTAPASAHGDDDEADAVNLVEQALAIVVNTPAAADEALERVEAARAAEAEEPSGELDIASLELAAVALENGDLHEAEDALMGALGSDPHAGADSPVEPAGGPSSDSGAEPAGEPSGAAGAAEAEDPAQDPAAEPLEDLSAEDGLLATGVAAHGLTDRVDGGFRAPSGTDVAALAAAAVLAAGGFALVRRKRGGHT